MLASGLSSYRMPSVLLLLHRAYKFAEGLDYSDHKTISKECLLEGGVGSEREPTYLCQLGVYRSNRDPSSLQPTDKT